LNAVDKEVPYFFVLHGLNNLSADFTQHQISFLIFERVVEARFRALLEVLNKWRNFFNSCVRLSEHYLTSKRVNYFLLFKSGFPLSTDKVISLGLRAQVFRIHGGKGFQDVGEVSLISSLRQ
jgi:hypothetical protein